MKQRVLVTGASGLLGNRLGEVLARAGHEVVGTFHGHADRVWSNGFADRVSCDLTRASEVARLWRERSFDLVVHAAALTDVNRCEQARDEAYAANVVATRTIARAAREHRARLLYVSTSSVFDGQTGNYVEDDVPNPCNYYSWTKLLGEEIARASGDSLVLRATLIGVHPKRPGGGNFLEWLIGALRNDKDVSLFDDIRINPLSDVSLAELVASLFALDFDGSVLHAGTQDPWSKAAIGQYLMKRIPSYRGKATIQNSDAAGVVGAKRAREMWLNVHRLSALKIVSPHTPSAELDRIAEYAL